MCSLIYVNKLFYKQVSLTLKGSEQILTMGKKHVSKYNKNGTFRETTYITETELIAKGQTEGSE